MPLMPYDHFDTEPEPRSEVARALFEYGAQQEKVVKEMSTLWEELEPVLASVPEVNQALYLARGDNELAIKERATMKKISTIYDIVDYRTAGSFNLDFIVTMGRTPSHAIRPAYQRLQCLRPLFVAGLVQELSRDRGSSATDNPIYAVPLFVAYQAMARLVDRKDPNVILPDSGGKVDQNYLVKPPREIIPI